METKEEQNDCEDVRVSDPKTVSADAIAEEVSEVCAVAETAVAPRGSTRLRRTAVKDWLFAHKEVYWLLCLPVLMLSYMLINKFLPPKWTVWVPADDLIPFCEYFIIPYCIWYVVYPGSLIFFLFKDKKAYLHLCFVMIGGLLISTIFYLALPNHVPFENVGPEGDGFFAQWTNLIRSGATRSAAFPSEHCVVAIAIDLAVQHSGFFHKRFVWRVASFLFMLSVCAATVFLKQHSILDMFASLIVCFLLHIVFIYYGWYKESKRERAAALMQAGENGKTDAEPTEK